MPGSIQGSHFVDGPISEYGFTVNVLLRNEAPHAAVVGLITVVAQNVEVAGLDINRGIGAVIHELGQDVILIQRLVVDVNHAAADFNNIAGHADDALDVG